jgi:hypothetical protein
MSGGPSDLATHGIDPFRTWAASCTARNSSIIELSLLWKLVAWEYYRGTLHTFVPRSVLVRPYPDSLHTVSAVRY